mgnify:CR=1 FL=1
MLDNGGFVQTLPLTVDDVFERRASTSSMAKQARPASSPTSKIVMMLGMRDAAGRSPRNVSATLRHGRESVKSPRRMVFDRNVAANHRSWLL